MTALAGGVSPEGVYGLLGNVSQWVADTYHPSFEGAPSDGSAWVDGGKGRVRKGSHYYMAGRTAHSAYRLYDQPEQAWEFLGFRCARSLEGPNRPVAAPEPAPRGAPITFREAQTVLYEHCTPCHKGETTTGCVGGTCMASFEEANFGLDTCCNGLGGATDCAPAERISMARCGLKRIAGFLKEGKEPLPDEQVRLLERWVQQHDDAAP